MLYGLIWCYIGCLCTLLAWESRWDCQLWQNDCEIDVREEGRSFCSSQASFESGKYLHQYVHSKWWYLELCGSISLSLSFKGSADHLVVTQYHYTEWPESGAPKDPAPLLKLLDQLLHNQMNTGNKAITVMCK